MEEKNIHQIMKYLSAYSNVAAIPTLCKTNNDEGAHFHLASRD